MTIKHKNIIINTAGPIRLKSGIFGPILTPYKEKIETVVALVTHGYNVFEVLENGEKVKLTLQNANKDLNAEIKVTTPPVAQKPVTNTKPEATQQPATTTPKEEKKEEKVDPSNKTVADTAKKK